MTCIYHYNILQNHVTVLKILYNPPIHPSLPCPKPVATTDLFTVPIYLCCYQNPF